MAASVVDGYKPYLKRMVDSSNLKEVPSDFKYIVDEPNALNSDALPVIDFSALASEDPDLSSKAIHDLTKACEEWGFFFLVNHGMGKDLMDSAFAAVAEFMSLEADEKKQYESNLSLDPITCGGFKVIAENSKQSITLWREYLKCHVHPQLNCPPKPQVLREVVGKFAEKTREISGKLLGCLLNALDLEQEDVKALGLDSSFQLFAANYYPRCPKPDEAMGLPPHTDYGLITVLIHNGIPGLQVEHNGHWFKVEGPTDYMFVNIADNLTSFSNGRYKSVKHRAVVNAERDRMSIVSSFGPSMEAIVGPPAPLVERDGRANYSSITYKEYVEWVLIKRQLGFKNPLACPHDD